MGGGSNQPPSPDDFVVSRVSVREGLGRPGVCCCARWIERWNLGQLGWVAIKAAFYLVHGRWRINSPVRGRSGTQRADGQRRKGVVNFGRFTAT